MVTLRVRFATRGGRTTLPLGSVTFSCAKSKGVDKSSCVPLIPAIVIFDSRRACSAFDRVAVSGIRSSSPTCQPDGGLARVTVVAPDEMLPTDSTHAVLLQPTRV